MSQNGEETKRVRVVCPVCDKSEYLEVLVSVLKSSGKGLTTILIPDNTVCSHSFQIFVDKNGAVRGYETPDFELKFTPSQDTVVTEQLADKSAFHILKSSLGEEIFVKCIRTELCGAPIFCISEQKNIQDILKLFFDKTFKDHKTELILIGLDEYNTSYRQRVYSSQYKNAFVFNSDITVIIKQKFKDKAFRSDKFDLEKSLFNEIDSDKMKDERIFEVLFSKIKNIIEVLTTIKQDIEGKKIKTKKDCEVRFKKETKFDVKFETIDDILKSRFEFDAEKVFFNVDVKVDKLNSLF